MLKVGVLGAGAIGCFVGGKLAAHGDDVVLVGRQRLCDELAEHGLVVEDIGGARTKVDAARYRVTTAVEELSGCDVILVCVKSAQTPEVAKDLARIGIAKTAYVVSLQNGVRNADVLRENIPGHDDRVLGGIVGFNVVTPASDKGLFRRATTGPLVIEQPGESRPKVLDELAVHLRDAGLEVHVVTDIRGQQWSKLVMNLNNAIGALTDAPTRALVFESRYRRIVRLVMREALEVMAAAGVKPARLGPISVKLFPAVLSLPTPLLRVVARVQVQIDPEARSSMWEDLARRRPTEIDFLNGEIVRLAASVGRRAPVNERIVELVHEAEKKMMGSPKIGGEALYADLVTRRR
ncbi:MAG: 2-dehydropantoate 2-reductase [Deltaproteobacteria bacterium]|nr:2-dehydropantoate 2-reductase [Deltaproteobacteria bacterium]